MSLPELMFSRLEAGLLPKTYPVKPYTVRAGGLLRDGRYARAKVINRVGMVKPLSFLKPVRVEAADFSGYRTTYGDAYISVYGDELTFKADYKSSMTSTADCVQVVDGVEKSVRVMFVGASPYNIEIKHRVEEPKEVTQLADVRRGVILVVDRVTKTYPIGLLDYRAKPIGEYPVPGVDNAVLDIAYDWRVANLIYPLPLPEGLTITDMSFSVVSGFLPYEGRFYKDPNRDNTVKIGWTLVNRTGYRLVLKHWGLPLSVLYEDGRHVSQVDIAVSVADRTLENGRSTRYEVTFNLPDFAYGWVAPAYAHRIYRDGMPLYFGGPLFCYEVGRLRLP